MNKKKEKLNIDWDAVLDRMIYWGEQDEKWNKAAEDFYRLLAPSLDERIIEDSYVEAFLAGVTSNDDKSDHSLYWWLTYWYYDAKHMEGGCEVKDDNGEEYDFAKREDVIKFLSTWF